MFDPRLYILGALALLSLVSVAYLIVVTIQHFGRAARMRNESPDASLAADARVDVSDEPVVPAGPPPVLDSDPFRSLGPALSPMAGEGVATAQQAPSPEPAASAPSSIAAGLETRVEPQEADQTDRIAALLESLERQVEAEMAAPPAALSSAPAVEPQGEPAAAPTPVPPVQLPVPPIQEPGSEPVPAQPPPDYLLVAPVELHFTDGSGRVGVRPGTRTHDEFQRLANALLGELRRSRTGPGQ